MSKKQIITQEEFDEMLNFVVQEATKEMQGKLTKYIMFKEDYIRLANKSLKERYDIK